MQQSTRLRILCAGVFLTACGLLPGFSQYSTIRSGTAAYACIAIEADHAASAATVEQAAEILDLRKLPLPDGATVPELRPIGMLNYQSSSDPKAAFQFHQQQLLKLGWKELPDTKMEAVYATGMFSKSGFVVSVSTSSSGAPNSPGASLVSLINFGNVRLNSLPVVDGAKLMFASDATAIYITESPVAETAEKLHGMLLKAGWEPWGSNEVSADQKHFAVKRNAVQISAMVNLAPAQGGRTSFMYSSQILSADIPAPQNASELNYDDQHKVLRFAVQGSFHDVGAFYREALGKRGWKGTTEDLVTMQDKFKRPVALQVFRNAAQDVMTLNLSGKKPDTRVEVRHQTQQEAAEEEQRSRAAAEKLVAEREGREKQAEMKKAANAEEPSFDELAAAALQDALGGGNKSARGKAADDSSPDKNAVRILVPAQVKKINQTGKNVLQIKVAAGKGKSTAEFVIAQLTAEGWKSDEDTDLKTRSGNVTLVRGQQRISLNYVDTGFADVNIMLIAIGANLEAATAKP